MLGFLEFLSEKIVSEKKQVLRARCEENVSFFKIMADLGTGKISRFQRCLNFDNFISKNRYSRFATRYTRCKVNFEKKYNI